MAYRIYHILHPVYRATHIITIWHTRGRNTTGRRVETINNMCQRANEPHGGQEDGCTLSDQTLAVFSTKALVGTGATRT
eukprot:4784127-Lingulodinium_polyedra.AAC.1